MKVVVVPKMLYFVKFTVFFLLFFGDCASATPQPGMLYPRDSESRQIKHLDGMWNFRADKSSARNASFEEKWFTQPLHKTGPVIPMPVPSSFNDITQDKSLRDFVGWVWYDTEFYAPMDWITLKKRVVLRFDSAHYYSIVWLNSEHLMEHNGGHLPFEAEVNNLLNYGGVNRVTIAINNTLTPHTLPPGTIEYGADKGRYPPGFFKQILQFDFFNYAGIHRSVKLYTTPFTHYISDITIVTDVAGSNGIVKYTVIGDQSPMDCKVEVIDMDGFIVGRQNGSQGQITVTNANFWWPYTMTAEKPGYMYTLKVHAWDDFYRQPFGIRVVKVTDKQLLINNRPFYCHGVAKHEDSDIRGKGLDFALIAKDFNLLKWLGANCFRTSHYPYAEEIMDQADRQGIAVIDESPGVGIKTVANMNNVSLAHHLEVMGELVRRDKNRPSVIMWSVANEPASSRDEARPYFKAVIEHTRSLDNTRPVTYVNGGVGPTSDKVVEYVDVICLNHYYAWYSDCGYIDVIPYQLKSDLNDWNALHKKPVIITEYGADTVVGLHQEPSFIFTEEYQVDFMSQYHKVFDEFRKDFLVGEMVWNFADFMTDQQINRVVGNRKGVLTRQRQPKMSGHLLRERYQKLINGTNSGIHTYLKYSVINNP
ncbi:hypothetical protein ScPMuIL_006807 [Solemya velum]